MSLSDVPKTLMCTCGVGSRRTSDLLIIAILLKHFLKTPQSTFANADYCFLACTLLFLPCCTAVRVGTYYSGDLGICSLLEIIWERTPKDVLYPSLSQERKILPEILPQSMSRSVSWE